MPEERREQVTRVAINRVNGLTGGTRRSRWKDAAFNGWHEPDKSRGLCPESVSGSGCKSSGRLGLGVEFPGPTLPLYCTRNRKGNFRVGLCTEKSRLRRALMRLQDQMRRMRHSPLQEQADRLNQMLRGHYVYYGIAGNIRALRKVHRAVECYWRKMLSSRSWKGKVWWKQFQQIKEPFPLLRPKLYLPYGDLQALVTL